LFLHFSCVTSLLQCCSKRVLLPQVISEVILRALQPPEQEGVEPGAPPRQRVLPAASFRMDENITALQDAMGTCER
jgi:hypothetical protein